MGTDPLRKRPTTFSRSNKDVEIDTTAWTETPADKAKRLADEAAGIRKKKGGAVYNAEEEEARLRKRARDEEIRRGVDKHTVSLARWSHPRHFSCSAHYQASTRGASLLEQHAAKKSKKDEEPAAIWDHARDMGITGRLLSDQERSEKIRQARDLNDRFGHSKRGAYDF